MSEDWRVGDLALCIRRGKWMSLRNPDSDGPWPGSLHTVEGIYENPRRKGRTGLGFPEWPEDAFEISFFRKIHPHSPDEQDADTIRLLNRVLADPVQA